MCSSLQLKRKSETGQPENNAIVGIIRRGGVPLESVAKTREMSGLAWACFLYSPLLEDELCLDEITLRYDWQPGASGTLKQSVSGSER